MSKYRNYSAWPLDNTTNDGINQVLTPMGSQVNKKVLDAQVFKNSDHFADDCRFGCGDMVSKLSANGDRIAGKDIFNLGTNILGIWASDQKSKADLEAAEKAKEITRLQILEEQAKQKTAEQEAAKSKVTITIVAIGGAVILAGFAAYFLFAKKQ